LLSITGLALIAAFMLVLGSFSSSDRAEAATEANDGVYDILVPGGTIAVPDESTGLYHCISYIDENGAGTALTSTAQCYADVQLGDANGEPPDPPGEGPDGVGATPGPKPPPPYTTIAPSVGTGTITGTASTVTTCFADTGGVSGPNIIAVVNDANYTTDFAGDGESHGTLDLYFGQPNAACAALVPVGSPTTVLPVVFYSVADKTGAAQGADDAAGCVNSWRAVTTLAGCTDFDGDGCTDAEELALASHTTGGPSTTGCGDDPFNPEDGRADARGTYGILAQITKQNCPTLIASCSGAQTAGTYYSCLAVVNEGPIVARVSCYLDSPGLDVNPQGFPGCKGDGSPGAAPPGKVTNAANPANCNLASDPTDKKLWGDINLKHTELSGTLTGASLNLKGCFEDDDGASPLGNVRADATINIHTGIGTVDIYGYVGDTAGCIAGTAGPVPATVPVLAARQSHDKLKDSDEDGCTDWEELSETQGSGGLRDPSNRYDYYDVHPATGNGTIDLFNDIFGVAGKFGSSPAGGAPYDKYFDRGAFIPGSNGWNIQGPDGTIDLFNDIFGVAFQFGHTCTGHPHAIYPVY
jgi:hypothetical protein